MRRNIEFESRKLKSSSSHEKTPKYRPHNLAYQYETPLPVKSPKCHNLISRNEPNDSFNTCIFPFDFTRELSTKSTCAIQTDPSLFNLESLQQENSYLKSEINSLKSEISSLKSFIQQASHFKTLAKLKANQEIIEMLQNENNLLKKSLESE